MGQRFGWALVVPKRSPLVAAPLHEPGPGTAGGMFGLASRCLPAFNSRKFVDRPDGRFTVPVGVHLVFGLRVQGRLSPAALLAPYAPHSAHHTVVPNIILWCHAPTGPQPPCNCPAFFANADVMDPLHLCGAIAAHVVDDAMQTSHCNPPRSFGCSLCPPSPHDLITNYFLFVIKPLASLPSSSSSPASLQWLLCVMRRRPCTEPSFCCSREKLTAPILFYNLFDQHRLLRFKFEKRG